jgi:hypothetical protein
MRFCFQPAVYERAIWFWLDRHLESTDGEGNRRAAGRHAARRRARRAAGFLYRRSAARRLARAARLSADRRGRARVGRRRSRSSPTARACAAGSNTHCIAKRPGDSSAPCSTGRDSVSSTARRAASSLPRCSRRNDLRLEVVALPQLPDWLGAVASQPASRPPRRPNDGLRTGTRRQWAATVALGGGQADAATAHTLRAGLGLPASPWEVDRGSRRHCPARRPPPADQLAVAQRAARDGEHALRRTTAWRGGRWRGGRSATSRLTRKSGRRKTPCSPGGLARRAGAGRSSARCCSCTPTPKPPPTG